MVSIWSPTFLTALLDPLETWWPAICRDLSQGHVDLPVKCDADAAIARRVVRRPDPARAKGLTEIFSAPSTASEKFAAVWPRLGMISCWTDASAARYVPELCEKFAGIEIQPKGLLATEGVVSIPRVSCKGTALALRSHFLEFAEVTENCETQVGFGTIRLAHELELQRTYQVILTTGGGLYRYCLGDLIRVVGWFKQCPLIEFLGRASASSDLVGEKLHERHVREVLEDAFAEESISPEFFLLAPVSAPRPRYYLFLQDAGSSQSSSWARSLARRVQSGLENNPYYRHATRMGQLDEVQVALLKSGEGLALNVYERECIARGQKAGDIKPVALSSNTDWLNAFAHLMIDHSCTRQTRHATESIPFK